MLLSVAGIGTCCSAVKRGSDGGGRDWVPVMETSVSSEAIVLNSGIVVSIRGGVVVSKRD